MSEGRILRGDVLPQAPAAAGAYLRIAHRCVVLVTVDGALGAASVGDKHQIVFRQRNLRAPRRSPGTRWRVAVFFPPLISKQHIGHLRAKLELHARRPPDISASAGSGIRTGCSG